MSTVDFTGARWRKSSRSGGGEGNACVEVAFAESSWRKSSRSGSGNGNACVEVAFACHAVGVRDSKNVAGSHLEFSELAWRRFAASR